MAHTHTPVIKVTKLPKGTVVNALKTTPFALATALGWTIGTAWHLLVMLASAVGIVLGTTFLAVKHLGFALLYGFFKGAQIKLVPKNQQPRNPSMPM